MFIHFSKNCKIFSFCSSRLTLYAFFHFLDFSILPFIFNGVQELSFFVFFLSIVVRAFVFFLGEDFPTHVFFPLFLHVS